MSGPRLVSLRQAAEVIGCGYTTLQQAVKRAPDQWPAPAGRKRLDGASRPSVLYDLEAMAAVAERLQIGRREWSSAEMRAVHDLSLTTEEAARRIGRSQSMVSTKRRELGLTRQRTRPEDAVRAVGILARLDAGETLAQVADDLGVTRQAVGQLARAWRPRIVTRAQAAEALGYSVSSLATMMSSNPDRWPAPIGHRKNRAGRGRVLLYDLHALIAAAGRAGARSTRIGEGVTVSDDDGLLTCLECGRRFRGLSSHLWRAHGMRGAEYREAHGLPATAALMSDDTRRLHQEAGRARRDAGELEHLAEWQTPEHLRSIGQEKGAPDPSAGSRDHKAVKRNRRPGQEHAVVRMVAARMRKLDEKARAHGYANAADAVEKTRDLSAKAAARATGLGANTITRWRAK